MALNSFQRELVRKLTDPSLPTRVAIQAEVGTGISVVVEELISHFSRATTVLLLTPNYNMILEQWLSLLQERDDISQVYKLTVPVAVEMLDQGVPTSGIVFVAKLMDVARPAVERFLGEWRPGILIVDRASPGINADASSVKPNRSRKLIETAASASHRTIVVGNEFTDGIPVIGRLSRLGSHRFELQQYRFILAPDEAALLEIAGKFTQQNPRKNWPDSPTTRPTLMDRLLRIATAVPAVEEVEASSDVGITEQAWAHIDALERLGGDPRLEALDEAVDGCDLERLIVLAPTTADLDYVKQHFESTRTEFSQSESGVQDNSQPRSPSQPATGRRLFACTPSDLKRLITAQDSFGIVIWSRTDQILNQVSEFLGSSNPLPYVATLDVATLKPTTPLQSQ